MSPSRISKMAPFIIVLATVLFFVSVWGIARYYLGQYSIPSEIIYGGPLPEQIKPLASFRAQDGITADLYNDTDHTKVGFGFSFKPPEIDSAPTGEEAIRLLISQRSTKQVDPRFSEFTAKYLGAQFDPRRAHNISPVTVKLQSGEVLGAQFNSTSEWFHLIGVVNLPHGQFAFQSVRKNSAVDPSTVSAIITREIEASRNWATLLPQ